MRNIVSPLEGIRSPFGPRYGGFSPASLFAAGEQGVWYDPSDFSTMFQDVAGTTPVTAVEQPVGLLLDKSQGLAIGGEIVTNGDFSNGTTGWTGTSSAVLSNPSGALVVTYNAVANPGTQGSGAIVAGAWYIVSYTVTAMTNGTIALYVGSSNAGGATNLTAPGTKSVYIQATNTTPINIVGFGNTGSFTIDNVSVKRIAGNHATQSTTASRPVLSARVNLLTYSEQFDNAAWAKAGSPIATVTTNDTTAPNGTLTADKVLQGPGGGYILQSVAGAVSTAYTFSVCCKPDVASRIFLYIGGGGVGGADGGVRFNAATGAFIATVGAAVSSYSATVLSDGWIRYFLTFTTGAADSTFDVIVQFTDASNSLVNQTGWVWGADLRPTNQTTLLPAYQRIAAATDYDTTGFPYYLRFDGTDDSMATGTITPGIDKVQVFAGVRKQSDAASAILLESSVNAGINNGALYVVTGPDPAGAVNRYSALTRGSIGVSTSNVATTNLGNAPDQAVLSTTHDIAGDLTTIRRNGVAGTNATVDLGTGNFLAYPLYIGSRAGTSSRLNGNLYSLIVRFGANLDATTISNTDTYVNGKTMAY